MLALGILVARRIRSGEDFLLGGRGLGTPLATLVGTGSSLGAVGFAFENGWALVPAISLAVVIAVGVLATPSYRHRIYSASSTATVRKSFVLSGIFFAVLALLPAIAGLSAAVLNPGIDNADFAFPYLAPQVFPVWIGALLLVSGLSATMSSGDSDAIAGVTILFRDVYQTLTGRLPARERMVLLSRVSLAGALVAGVLVSLLTPRKPISREEALRILDGERAQMDVGTQIRASEEG